MFTPLLSKWVISLIAIEMPIFYIFIESESIYS